MIRILFEYNQIKYESCHSDDNRKMVDVTVQHIAGISNMIIN